MPGNLNLSFAYIEGESLMMGIKNLAVSSGSACTSASLEPSYVLKALGVEEELAHTSLRIGIGRFTTEDDVNNAGAKYIDAAVVEDGGIITSPHYKYLGDWMQLIISKFND